LMTPLIQIKNVQSLILLKFMRNTSRKQQKIQQMNCQLQNRASLKVSQEKGMEQSANIKSEQVAEPPKKDLIIQKNETR